MRISDWSSDVCSSDLVEPDDVAADHDGVAGQHPRPPLDVGTAVRAGESEYRRRGQRGGPKMCGRSEERRAGTEGISRFRICGSTYHSNKTHNNKQILQYKRVITTHFIHTTQSN